ncbi:iron-containing alcohol dehydrogenase [Marinoscillum sp. MHG1-6]|uniref:iron-containing alcohol dehydrogenase n=1 Tax=Marinoscillum sp. MHG1-6 TaxID=2959627 RepID=UPI002157E7A0|nr:iron-containing alcohol dehydrogenase [Marinoscillum sp. MHG1-6]
MNNRLTFNFPTPIRFGLGVIDELPGHIISKGLRHPLIVTDSVVQTLDFFKEIVDALKEAGLAVDIYSDMHKNPVASDVLRGGEVYQEGDCDCIVGIGGGVALDVSRAIALRVNHHRDLFDYDDLIGGDAYITEEIPYFITVPTTAGTGSEVGRSAIIAEDATKKKRILFSPTLMAKRVFADPNLTMELPPFITAATGMDALTHNMEAYLAKNYNPMCDGVALEGMALIAHSIEKATHHPDEQSRANMMLGSIMGGIAFQKGLGVVHSLAHPMSSLLDTHHGLANAVNLPYGMEFNYDGFEARFDKMAEFLGVIDSNGEHLVDFLFELNERLNIPTKLSEVGVEDRHLDPLSVLAYEDFCHPANPKPVTESDFKALYRKAF